MNRKLEGSGTADTNACDDPPMEPAMKFSDKSGKICVMPRSLPGDKTPKLDRDNVSVPALVNVNGTEYKSKVTPLVSVVVGAKIAPTSIFDGLLAVTRGVPGFVKTNDPDSVDGEPMLTLLMPEKLIGLEIPPMLVKFPADSPVGVTDTLTTPFVPLNDTVDS